MFNVDDFFTVFKFYRHNSNVIGLDDEAKIALSCPAGTNAIDENNNCVVCLNGIDENGNCIEIPNQPTTEIVGNICPTDTQFVRDGLCLDSDTVQIDESIRQIAVDSKILATQFFERTLDVPVHNNPDFNKLRALFIDWYSSNRTFATIQRVSSNPQSLDVTLLEQAIRSFGFPYASLINKKDVRAQFLLSLAEIYKIKGTPQSIISALKFFGFPNLRIYEWWATRTGCDIFFEGRKLITGEVDDESAFPDTRELTYGDFLKIADPHWFYTEDQILHLDKNTEHGLIGLPSITPYFSLATTADIKGFEKIYSAISRLVKDQYENHLAGNNVPEDIFIDEAGFSVSLLSLFMGILYSWNNWNDWLKYVKLRDYIIEEFGIVPELDDDSFVLSFPNAYEKLLFWTITRTDENGDPDPLDITASGKIWGYPIQVEKITDLPDSANEGDKILVLVGLSGNHEEWRYDGTDWQLIEEFPEGMGTDRLPRSGTPFALYPPCIESYINEVDVSGGRDDTPLDYDISIIRYDEQVFYPLLNNAGKISDKCKYLYAQDENIPNYNQPFPQLPELTTAIEANHERFDEITVRPSDRDDWEEKFEAFDTEFTRLQSLNCIQNKYDPQRILQGLTPVATVADLPTEDINEGDTILVNSGVSGDPEVYKYTGGTWVIDPDGLLTGNLGVDQRFKDWIDQQVVADRFAFEDLIEDLMIELDTWSATVIGVTPIDLKQLAMGIPNIGESLFPVLDFFKPKRARFLSYELIHQINDPVGDSVNLEDDLRLNATLRVPHESPDSMRGGFPEDYDEYEWGHDANNLYDDVSIEVTEGGVPVDPEDWCCPTPP
jgi:hypothetical protein